MGDFRLGHAADPDSRFPIGIQEPCKMAFVSELRQSAKELNPIKVRELLLSGSDPNERSGPDFRTPLHDCLIASRWEEWGEVTVRVLLQYGADPNLPDEKGRMPIADSMRLSTMRLLLEAGAEPDIQFGAEASVPHQARFGDKDRVRLLLEFGANPSVQNAKGNSIEDLLSRPRQDFTDNPKRVAASEKALWEFSQGLTLSPEEYVAKNRNVLIWGFQGYAFKNEGLRPWSDRVGRLLANPTELRHCYETYLEGAELEQALRDNAKDLVWQRERQEREALAEEYVSAFGLPEAPFPFSRLV
jgi:hypothetical protein